MRVCVSVPVCVSAYSINARINKPHWAPGADATEIESAGQSKKKRQQETGRNEGGREGGGSRKINIIAAKKI